MAFRPDSPFELPNDRLVCSSYRLGVCAICTNDYDFMHEREDEDHEETDDSDYQVDPRGFMPSDSNSAEPGASQAPLGFVGFNFTPPESPSTGSSGPSISSFTITSGPDTLRPLFNFMGRVIPKMIVPPRLTDRLEALFPLIGGRPSTLDPSISARFIRYTN